jgi:AcrR family transcriptional regulator
MEIFPPLCRIIFTVRLHRESVEFSDQASQAEDPHTSVEQGSTRPLRRDAEANRQRIVDAALDLFAHRGLEVSLDEIARHAGLGVGTVYRRFPSKEALVEALFEQRILEIIQFAQDALEIEDRWEGFQYLVEGICSMEVADHGLRDVILRGDYLRDRITTLKREILPFIETLVERAKAEGGLRKDFSANDLPIIATMITAGADYCHNTSPTLWKRYMTYVLDGLRESRSDPTPLPAPPLNDDELQLTMVAFKARRTTHSQR